MNCREMIKKFSILLILGFLLVSPLFAQNKVDIVALRSGITQGTVTVTTSATAIPTTALSGRRCILIVNISSNNVFIGTSSVTTATGYQLYAQQAISIDVADNVTVYAISTTNSEVRYLQIR